ncbi:MAG: argininosuccinate lyase [Candidatus Riflebacteria bacterium HGW-Riflebacteria-1]|jgi:argininosuccinate lyase|nr:MAG: argininosuccinate lyase [Candidatus Riflebacteria bacterium HGW-Riflebacteria-1]
MKLWQKGYELNHEVERFTTGIDYLLDMRLIEFDCIASQAHARMLGNIGLISQHEAAELVGELNNLIELVRSGEFSIAPDQEDCHTAIEMYLTSKLGDTGKKIHTGRSRNDQVLTAIRLYTKTQLEKTLALTKRVIDAIAEFVERVGELPIPGFTHTRKAMPSSTKMWAESFKCSLEDDLIIIDCAIKLIDQSPLGTGAGYGIPLPLDREFVAHELGFSRVQKNPIHAQHSRSKFDIFAVNTLVQIMFDLNRLATDLIMFTLPEFDLFKLPDAFKTGSSIMPQKKNPDILELMRAKLHELNGYEHTIRSCTANLISGYNRDIQITKEPLIKAFEATVQTLGIAELLFANLSVNQEKCAAAMTEELFATEQAYKLVQEGIPFRDAYQMIAQKFMK